MPQISQELKDHFELHLADIQVALEKDDLPSTVSLAFSLLANILGNSTAKDENGEVAMCCHEEIAALQCIVRSLVFKGLLDDDMLNYYDNEDDEEYDDDDEDDLDDEDDED